MGNAQRVPVSAFTRPAAIGPPTKRIMSGIGKSTGARVPEAPRHDDVCCGYLHVRTQAIHVQPLDQSLRQVFVDIQKDVIPISNQKKVGKVFALRRQKRCVDNALGQLVDVIGDQPLQKFAGIAAR